jgi:ubiquitin carboxyl-terminal hydrolase L5
MEDQSGWCTIESDPGVFTELVENIGVRDVEFQEVVSLDEASLAELGEVLGLIFLFKWRDDVPPRNTMSAVPEGLFFAKQVINNACATQAILSVLMNTTPDQLDIGETLNDLRSFTEGLDDESKGFAIGNSELIRKSHNSFRPSVSLEILHEEDKRKGEAFHFVSYVWFNGKVFELDGLQAGPVQVGDCAERSSWLSVVGPHIQSRIEEYTSAGDSEIRFNLLAITKDRRTALKAQLESFQDKGDPVAVEIKNRLEDLEIRRSKWRNENIRRRHDFMPLALGCLEVLAEKGQLVSLFRKAAGRS